MFNKFTDINEKVVYLLTKTITMIGITATGQTFLAQNGETQGIMIKETPEEALKIIEAII